MNPNTWRIGQTVTLTDEITIQRLIEKNTPGAVKGRKMEIVGITRIAHDQFNLDYVQLIDDKGELCLAVKQVGYLQTIRLYEPISWFEQGDRREVLECNHTFLFNPPDDERDFIPKDLEFADEIVLKVDNVHVPYFAKYATLFGEAQQTLAEGNFKNLFVQMKEYKAGLSVANNELLVLELGGLDPNGNQLNDGGLVILLEGREINEFDVAI